MTELNVKINQALEIPLAEITFRFSRSSGPGGQNVNRVESKVELLFDLKNSPSLSDDQRTQLQDKLKNLLDADGVLHVVSQISRSQLQNRDDVIRRFQSVLQNALKPRKKRRPTRPTKAAKERRLHQKKKRAESKQKRKRPELD